MADVNHRLRQVLDDLKIASAERDVAQAGLGIRNWCPCCQNMNLRKQGNRKDRVTTRIINRYDRLDGRRQIEAGVAEWEEEG